MDVVKGDSINSTDITPERDCDQMVWAGLPPVASVVCFIVK
jgi:hypothetical protein